MTDQLIQGAHGARSTLAGNPIPPIADYGFLSDCEVSALVAPSGNVEWMCLPRMDGPSVFAASSLPETPGGERNYDCRFTWLRDSTFMLWGLYTLGLDREADDFFYFITELAEQDADLQIMYGIGGERELTEQTLDHLSGYDGTWP